MKNFVKRTIGHYRALLEHSLKRREPSPEHILKRLVIPLCQDFNYILQEGTKNDAWIALEGISRECSKAYKKIGK